MSITGPGPPRPPLPAGDSVRLAHGRRSAGRALFARWVLTVTAAEAVGFLAPAVAGAASIRLPALAGHLILLAAGAFEGAVLGAAQASVLSPVLPGLRRLRWVALTSAAAVAAYGLGLLMVSAGSSWQALTVRATAGILLLLSLGGAQWIELRRHVMSAGTWVLWTAVAWLLALVTFLVIATPLWHERQPVWVSVAIGAGAGVAMAGVQAAVTGWALIRLLELPRSEDRR